MKRSALNRHLLGHSIASGKAYLCDQCDSAFPLKDRLTQHIKNVHGPRKFVCTDCGAAFKRNDKLQRHCQSRHSDIKPYLCPIVTCGRAFKRIDGLRAHVRCSHLTEPGPSSFTLGCTVCGQIVSGQEKLVDHLMGHVKASPPSLLTAMSGELYSSMDEPGGSQQYTCPHCSVSVGSESMFYAHLMQHSHAAVFQSALPHALNPFMLPLGQNPLTGSNDWHDRQPKEDNSGSTSPGEYGYRKLEHSMTGDKIPRW